MIVGHGSRAGGFASAMVRVARALRRGRFFWQVGCAYLEIARPSIPEAVESYVKRGAGRIDVLPYFLQKGRHVQGDIPSIVKELRRKYRAKVRIVLCPYLGFDPRIVAVVKERLGQRGG